jgi:ERCC4-type nuclease
METPTKCLLTIDNRERNVTRHENDFANVWHIKKQLTTGDYAVSWQGNIIAVFERKSYTDYAASLKDGRADNKNKLLELRAKTNCRVFYIIEGDAFPAATKKYGNIPYIAIQSSMFHLMMRDNIMCIMTKDTLGTAKMLVDFVHSMDNLITKIGDLSFLEPSIFSGGADGDGGDSGAVNANSTDIATDLLVAPQQRSDHDIVREMWCCFRGISTETSDEFSKKWSIADIILRKIDRNEIMSFKMSSGRKITSTVINSLTGVQRAVEIRILSCVPMVSTKIAGELLTERTLAQVISSDIAMIAALKVHSGKKAFGDTRAQRLLKLFYYKYGESPKEFITSGIVLGQTPNDKIVTIVAESPTTSASSTIPTTMPTTTPTTTPTIISTTTPTTTPEPVIVKRKPRAPKKTKKNSLVDVNESQELPDNVILELKK